MTDTHGPLVEVLSRCESSFGHWRVLSRSDSSVVVGLLSCDDGEEMHRLTAVARN